jgi:DNA (cytosine-5)-methyltransferase 1
VRRPRRQPVLPAAEFFAGIGLVRQALEGAGFEVVFANDVEPTKHAMYAANFGGDHFRLGDVRCIHGDQVPSVALATASFPCTDLSLAGYRAGFAGAESSLFWDFARILREMGGRRPPVVLLENVPSFATSNGGEDLRLAVEALNSLGYSCDLIVADARRFVPQSRPRLFVVGAADPPSGADDWHGELRPAWVARFAAAHPELRLHAAPLRVPPSELRTLREVVERLHPSDERWWDERRTSLFVSSLSPIQHRRLERLRAGRRLSWATAYRRTRYGRAVWEIRDDEISGCLRTARGGSSKQAIVEAGRGNVRVRWVTPREYARLQGAPDYNLDGVRDNQARFGFGDAVCVPVVEWLARAYLRPLIEEGEPAEAAVA